MRLIPKVIGWESELPTITLADVRVQEWFGTRQIIQACPLRPRGPDGRPLGVRRRRAEFLPNGMRLYPENDEGLLEICTQEQLSARDAVASLLASFHLVDRCRRLAEQQAEGAFELEALVSSANDESSWGGHCNLLLSRECFDDLFGRRRHLLVQLLAPFLATAPCIFGFGEIAEPAEGQARFVPSLRAGFMGDLVHLGTTQGRRRPLINTRNEALADPKQFARLHTISLDPSISPWAAFVKFGTMQLIGLALEMRVVPQHLVLDDPVGAVQIAGSDATLRRRVCLASGRCLTPLQVQREIAEFIRDRIVHPGDAEPCVPEAEVICDAWLETLDMLADDPTTAGRRVDWVTKKLLLEQAMDQSGGDWDDEEVQYLALMYGSVNLGENPYFDGSADFVPARGADQVVTAGQVARLVTQPPSDTRAWVRGHILSRFAEETSDVDWHWVRFRERERGWNWREVALDHPFRLNEYTCGDVVENGSLEEIADRVEALCWEPGSARPRTREDAGVYTRSRAQPAPARRGEVKRVPEQGDTLPAMPEPAGSQADSQSRPASRPHPSPVRAERAAAGTSEARSDD